jgi:chemotaxis protein histidine kinase CheA
MTANMDAFQALLASMREAFLDELPERCGHFDALILSLETSPDDREAFNELYRGVHSLKGSGGTHGLSIITTICHQLENLLSETEARQAFGTVFATRARPTSTCCARSRRLPIRPSPTIQPSRPNWRPCAN